MNDFFERIPKDGIPEFGMFSFTHLLTASVLALLIFLFIKNVERISKFKHEKYIRYFVGCSMIFTNLTLYLHHYQLQNPWYMYLPIATCGWAIYAGGLALITKSRILTVLCVFWGFGAVLTILGPTVIEGPTKYNFYQFFYRHLTIILAGVYLTKGLGIKIYKKDFRIFFFVTITMLFLGGVLSYAVNDPNNLNLFYTMKPGIDIEPISWVHDLNYFVYITLWIITGSVMGYLYGLPFYEKNK